MTTVQVMSDLHLEFADIVLPGGDVLILAGDIWVARHMYPGANPELRKRYARFCTDELSKYSQVIVITGNHEAYASNIDDMNDTVSRFLRLHTTNARLSCNETVVIDGLAFLCTPLWARCGVGNPAHEREVAGYMNDFRLIRTSKPPLPGSMVYYVGRERVFAPHDANRLHIEAVDWLAMELPRHKRCVVVGHHAPSYISCQNSTRFDPGPIDSAYCSPLDEMIAAHRQIAIWVHGHTHRRENYRIRDTRVIANPRGYPNESTHRQFDPKALCFTIEDVLEGACA